MSAPMKVKCGFTEKVENSSDSSSCSDNEENECLKEAVIGMYLTSDEYLIGHYCIKKYSLGIEIPRIQVNATGSQNIYFRPGHVTCWDITQPSEEAQVQTVWQRAPGLGYKYSKLNHPRLRGQPYF